MVLKLLSVEYEGEWGENKRRRIFLCKDFHEKLVNCYLIAVISTKIRQYCVKDHMRLINKSIIERSVNQPVDRIIDLLNHSVYLF